MLRNSSVITKLRAPKIGADFLPTTYISELKAPNNLVAMKRIVGSTPSCLIGISRNTPTTRTAAGGSLAFAPSANKPYSSTQTVSQTSTEVSKTSKADPPKEEKREPSQPKKKTLAELDEEVRLKLEGMSGEGGAAGVEYENGRAEGLKRGVKQNMFRVI